MKSILLFLALATPLSAQGWQCFGCSAGGGVGVPNVSASCSGSSTSCAIDIHTLNLSALDTLLVQCKTAAAVVTITGISSTGSSPITTVTPTYLAPGSTVVCAANSNGGAGPSGPAGTAGQSVTATVENPGSNCATGGVKFVSASGTNYACNGANGSNGSNGSNGTNGTNGTNGQSVTVSAESPGVNCTYGGEKLIGASGTSYVCNGAPGAAGSGNNALCSDATGSTTTYTCPSPSPSVTSLAGLIVTFIPQTTNTGASTVNVAGLGAKSLLASDGATAMTSGQLVGGQAYSFSYDGSNFRQLQSGVSGPLCTGCSASIDFPTGTDPGAPSSGIFRITAGASGAVKWRMYNANAAGAITDDGSGNLSISPFSGTGNTVRATAPTLTAPVIASYTVASLPAHSTGTVAYVTDGATTSDCTTGGGSNKVLCVYNGSAWAFPGGSSGASGPSFSNTGYDKWNSFGPPDGNAQSVGAAGKIFAWYAFLPGAGITALNTLSADSSGTYCWAVYAPDGSALVRSGQISAPGLNYYQVSLGGDIGSGGKLLAFMASGSGMSYYRALDAAGQNSSTTNQGSHKGAFVANETGTCSGSPTWPSSISASSSGAFFPNVIWSN